MSGIDLVAAVLAGEGIALRVVCQREGSGHLAPLPQQTPESVAVGDGDVKQLAESSRRDLIAPPMPA